MTDETAQEMPPTLVADVRAAAGRAAERAAQMDAAVVALREYSTGERGRFTPTEAGLAYQFVRDFQIVLAAVFDAADDPVPQVEMTSTGCADQGSAGQPVRSGPGEAGALRAPDRPADPTYRVGDPDPTPWDRYVPEEQECGSEHGDFCCGWPKGHVGQHVAGDSSVVMAVWPQSTEGGAP